MLTKTLEELVQNFSAPVKVSAGEVLLAREREDDTVIYVVLDDDPTGTQSVADLPVLMTWEKEDFLWAFSTGEPAIYVMINSRSLAPDDAERVNREAVKAALAAAKEADVEVAFVSRSDSTLRGHFPLEPDTIGEEIEKATGQAVDGIVIVPAFGDAGRITVGGTHYAGSPADGYLPVGETEFAADATFGYESSHLPDWVAEKTAGDIPAESVLVLDLTILRSDREASGNLLRSAKNGTVIAVDIVTEDDLRLLALALISAEKAGSRFVYRVGPPFVRARIGQAVHEPLTVDEIEASRGDRELARGGLVVVGSHVALTTRQLNDLRENLEPFELELDVAKLIDNAVGDDYVSAIAKDAANALNSGNVAIRTSRKLVKGADGDSSLEISRKVSAGVVAVVSQILELNPPRFVVAKGGITSSDVASKGLEIGRAIVVGPMLPGIVSLWSGQDGPAAGIPYIVFAGNVGGDTSLTEVVHKLSS